MHRWNVRFLSSLLTPRWRLWIAVTSLVLSFVYIFESLKCHAAYERVKVNLRSDKVKYRIKRLESLTQIVHDTLQRHGISHFLFYGSIWGPLRGYNGPLPWDYDVDLGTIIEEDSELKFRLVMKELKALGISVESHFSAGLYKFHNTNRSDDTYNPTVDVFLLKQTLFGLTRRIGVEVWLLGIHYFVHHTFPFRLISGNLSEVIFAGRYIQVPRGGIEIMKYLYRYNWWLVRKPKDFNCVMNDVPVH